LCKCNGVGDPLEHALGPSPPHKCYLAKFGRSRSKGTNAIKENCLKKSDPLGNTLDGYKKLE